MGYEVLHTEKLKKDEEPAKMHLKNPQKLLEQDHKVKLAKVLVHLVLFEIELETLAKCIEKCKFSCTIMEALKARRNTTGGVDEAVGYLYTHNKCNAKGFSSTNTKPSSFANKAPANNMGAINTPANNMYPNNMSGNVIPTNNATEKPIDLRALPPPDHGEGDGFGSVTRHVNPSSHYDDDDNQLIKGSTLLGYRNPPEAKPQVMPGYLQPMPDPVGHHGDHRPPNWQQPTSMPLQTSYNRSDKYDKTHFEISGQDQYHWVDTRGLQRNESQCGNTRPPNMTPVVVFHDDTGKTGALHSLPSDPTRNADQIRSSPYVYKKQASTPCDSSLTGGNERIAPITTDATTSSNQLAVSDNNAVLIAAVPLTDNPIPEASQALPDSKYGKTNLNYLKNRLQHNKKVTQTLVQVGNASSQATSDYANAEISYQGVSDNAKIGLGKTDLTSLRNRMEKRKEEREKTLTASTVTKQDGDYYNWSEVSQYTAQNPVLINNPPLKKPLPNPRSVIPTNPANNNNNNNSLPTSSSKLQYRFWQCAHCKKISEAYNRSCEYCKLPLGSMAIRSTLCEICQLMIFIKKTSEFADICCSRCKRVFETTL